MFTLWQVWNIVHHDNNVNNELFVGSMLGRRPRQWPNIKPMAKMAKMYVA